MTGANGNKTTGLEVEGITTAVGFALESHKVIGTDIDLEKVMKVRDDTCPFSESER